MEETWNLMGTCMEKAQEFQHLQEQIFRFHEEDYITPQRAVELGLITEETAREIIAGLELLKEK